MIFFSEQVAQNLTRAPIIKSGVGVQLSIATSDATAQLEKRTVYRIISTVDCYFAMGDTAAVTAAATHAFLPANTVEYICTGFDDTSRYLSALGTAAGTMYVTECL